jgi:hypothetical protein
VLAILAISATLGILAVGCPKRADLPAERPAGAPSLPAERPAGAPADGTVLYWRDGALYSLDLALWKETRVTALRNPRTVACSPDGRYVAAIDAAGRNPEEGQELVLTDWETRETERRPCPADARALLWSPKGLYLAVESGTARPGKVAIFSVEDWRLVAEATGAVPAAQTAQTAQTALTSGLFSPDNAYYAYTFAVDTGLPGEGGGSSGIVLIDLTGRAPTTRVLFDGRDGYAYDVRDYYPEGLVYERRPVGDAPAGATAGAPGRASETDPEFGLVTSDGKVVALEPKDPLIRLTRRTALAKAAARCEGDLGPWGDLPEGGWWLVFSRVKNAESWVVVWGAASEVTDPIPLVSGRGGAWLKGPEVDWRSQMVDSAYPPYVRSLDPRLRLLDRHDLGQGRELLEATALPPPRDDFRLFFVHDSASGLYYLIIGEADNARFIRQDGEELVFAAQGGGGSPMLSFPYQPVYHLDTKTTEVRHPYLPVEQEVGFGMEGWAQVITTVSRTDDGLTLKLRPAEGAVLAGGWSVPWTVNAYDSESGVLTLILRCVSLGAGIKPGEAIGQVQDSRLLRSVTFEPAGEDLKIAVRLGAPALWKAAELRISGGVTSPADLQAFWDISFRPAP